MTNCTYCGSPTELYLAEIPICLACTEVSIDDPGPPKPTVALPLSSKAQTAAV